MPIYIQFGIRDFYPSIKEEILDGALNIAKIYKISEEQMNIIKHYYKTILFLREAVCFLFLSGGRGQFDISMGTLDSTKIGKSVSIYTYYPD